MQKNAQKWLTAAVMLMAGGIAAVLFYQNMNNSAKHRMKKYACRMLDEVGNAANELCPWTK